MNISDRFMALKYRKPTIKKNKDNKWYVEYFYFNPSTQKFKRFRVYEDINRFEGKERNDYAKDLRDAVHKALKMGYDPFEDEVITESKVSFLKVETTPTIIGLLDRFLADKIERKLSHKTISHYSTFVTHLKNWLVLTKNENKSIDFFDETQINIHLKYMLKTRNWKGNTYNNHRDEIIIFYNWLFDNELTERKLFTKKLLLLKSDTTRNEYYHGSVRDQVKSELIKHPVLDRFCKAIYYTCMRPYEELCHIKIGDLDFENSLIKIKTNVGKTGYRYVPICEELRDLFIKEMKVNECPIDYYIFSTNALPGPTIVPKNHFTLKYQKIKKTLNLGPEYTMYSWKHTRVTDLLLQGFTDAEVMDLTGHRDTSSYDHYKRNLGQKLNSKIKGKTIEF